MTPRDPFGTDLRLRFDADTGAADLVVEGGDIETVSGIDNLAQALALKLLVYRGELTDLGHPRYGSRIQELIGEPLDAANRELLRRYARATLLSDERVEEITRIEVHERSDAPGVIVVEAAVKAVSGEEAAVEVSLDVR